MGRCMTRSTRSTVAIGRTSCSLHANPTDSKEAAAATAAFRVLVGIFPGQLGTLQPLYDAYIAGLPDNPAGIEGCGDRYR